MKDFEDYAEKRIDMSKDFDVSEPLVIKTRGKRLEDLIREIQEKKKIVSLATWTGSYLLISILLSILVLRAREISWSP